MSTNQDLTEKDAAKNLKDFTRQPARTKEIELLADHAEKSTGRERVESDRRIRAKAGPRDRAKSS